MTRLNGPQEPSNDQITSRLSPTLDKGKAKMPEYEDNHFDGNESTHSLNSEFDGFDVPIIRSSRVKKGLTSANEKLRRSTREKNPVSRFGYNDYMAYHYSRTGNFFGGSQGSAMGQRNGRGNADTMQERDMRSRSPLATQKGDQMQMDIQSEVQCRRFRQPLQSTTRSERIRTNTWRRLRRNLCPSGKDCCKCVH